MYNKDFITNFMIAVKSLDKVSLVNPNNTFPDKCNFKTFKGFLIAFDTISYEVLWVLDYLVTFSKKFNNLVRIGSISIVWKAA